MDPRQHTLGRSVRLLADDAEKDLLVQLHPSLPDRGADSPRRRRELDPFKAFGFFLGAAFQIRDDILNLIGSRERYGKEIFGDIYEGKRTLMLARLASLVDASEHARLCRFLATPRSERKESEVTWVFDSMERHNCVAYARNAAARLAEGARAAFPAAFAGASGEDRDFVAHFLDFMIERDA